MSAQDNDIQEPSVRLRYVLALLRIIAGRRGHSAVKWHNAGFTYTLHATREPGNDALVTLDDDATAIGVDEARYELRARLRTQP